jgi:hypothetical protein
MAAVQCPPSRARATVHFSVHAASIACASLNGACVLLASFIRQVGIMARLLVVENATALG